MSNKNIIIVESPNKVSHIQKYVGSDYIVTSSVGHIVKINDSGKGRIGIDWENEFKADYVVDGDKTKVVKELKSILKENDGIVYLATDDDAEGEAISWHLRDQLKIPESRIKRAIFKEITQKGVQKGLAEAGKINENKASAALTRGKLDKLLGYKVSPITQKKAGGRSAGRVQSPALRLVVELEQKIKDFIPTEYFEIYKDLTVNGVVFEQIAYTGSDGKDNKTLKKLTDINETNDVINDCQSSSTVVTSLDTKKTTSEPKPPFITSSLQRECSNRYGYSPKTTMQLAQKLFEKGLITYMRTDSTRLSEEFIEDAKTNFIIPFFGDEAISGKVAVAKKKKDDDKNVQDAHEAIRPTDVNKNPNVMNAGGNNITEQEAKVYELIYRRTMAALMKPAQFETDYIIFKIKDKHTFVSKERRTIYPGYLYVYLPEDHEVDDVNKPKFIIGDSFDDYKVYQIAKTTKPPSRYTQATLIGKLEDMKIGRPSTFVSIISTITDEKRGYTVVEGGSIRPTELGETVVKFLTENFDNLTNYEYTAKMEGLLDSILNGEATDLEVLNEFYKDLSIAVEKAGGAESLKAEAVETGEECPKCGKVLVERDGRYGKFISCSGFPRCKWSPEKPKKEEVQYNGPKLQCSCGGEIIKKFSPKRNTHFYACNNYPKCKEAMSEDVFEKKYIESNTNPLSDT